MSNRSPADGRSRAVHVSIVVFYVALFFALIWPVYPTFATIEPRILGVPHSLAYVVEGLLLSFFVLLAFFLWENARGINDPIEEDD